MTVYVNYTVKDGDTLESIATSTLGTPARWRELALLNRLRAPFISNDPIHQYGTALVTGALTTAIAADARTYQFQSSELPVFASTYAKENIFYVQYWEYLDPSTSGAVKYDAMALAAAIDETTGLLNFTPNRDLYIVQAITSSMSAQTVSVTNTKNCFKGAKLKVDVGGSQEIITLTDVSDLTITAVFAQNHSAGVQASYGFDNSYALGTTFYLFPSVRSHQTQVLQTGDVLRIPDYRVGQSNVASNTEELFLDYLGSDIRILPDGSLQFDTSGRFDTVTGTVNLAQAIRLRLDSPPRSLIHHPAYGNALWDHIGDDAHDLHFGALAEGLIRETLLSDPRIELVKSVTIQNGGESIRVDAVVQIRSGSALVRLDNLVLRVGG